MMCSPILIPSAGNSADLPKERKKKEKHIEYSGFGNVKALTYILTLY